MFLLCRDHDIGLCEQHKNQCADVKCVPQSDPRVKGCMICDGMLLPRDDRARVNTAFKKSEGKFNNEL